MYNRFSVKKKKEWPGERGKRWHWRRWVAQLEKKKKKKKLGEKRTETSPPFIMRCVLLWHFPTLFYTHSHTYVVQHTYIYIYLTLFIYTNTGTTPNMVVRKLPAAGELEREKRREEKSCGPEWLVVVVHRAITHFNRIIHQDLKRAAHIMPLLHRYITVDVFMMTKRSDSDDKSQSARPAKVFRSCMYVQRRIVYSRALLWRVWKCVCIMWNLWVVCTYPPGVIDCEYGRLAFNSRRRMTCHSSLAQLNSMRLIV